MVLIRFNRSTLKMVNGSNLLLQLRKTIIDDDKFGIEHNISKNDKRLIVGNPGSTSNVALDEVKIFEIPKVNLWKRIGNPLRVGEETTNKSLVSLNQDGSIMATCKIDDFTIEIYNKTNDQWIKMNNNPDLLILIRRR